MSECINCPKCGELINDDEAYEMDDGEIVVRECPACAFRFVVECVMHPSYLCSCEQHEWATPECGDNTARKRCDVCGKTEIAKE